MKYGIETLGKIAPHHRENIEFFFQSCSFFKKHAVTGLESIARDAVSIHHHGDALF